MSNQTNASFPSSSQNRITIDNEFDKNSGPGSRTITQGQETTPYAKSTTSPTTTTTTTTTTPLLEHDSITTARPDGINSNIQSASFPQNYGWPDSMTIASFRDLFLDYEHKLEVDSTGNIHAVWREPNGSNGVIKASILPFNASLWIPPVILSNSIPYNKGTELSIDASGTGMAAWTNELGVIQTELFINGSWVLPPMDFPPSTLANKAVSVPFTCIDHTGQTLVKLTISDCENILNDPRQSTKLKFATKHSLKYSICIDDESLTADTMYLISLLTSFINSNGANIVQFYFDIITKNNVKKILPILFTIFINLKDKLTSVTSVHINELAKNTSFALPPSSFQFISCDNYFGSILLKELTRPFHLQIKTFDGQGDLAGPMIQKLTLINSFKSHPYSWQKDSIAQDLPLLLDGLTSLETLIARSTGPLVLQGAFDSLETIDLFENIGNEEASLTIETYAVFPKLKTLNIRSECTIQLKQRARNPFPALETFTYPRALEDDSAIKQITQKIEERKSLALNKL